MNNSVSKDQQYRAALALPFDVLIVTSISFPTYAEADLLCNTVYESFPAFEVMEQEYINAWNGTVYYVDAPEGDKTVDRGEDKDAEDEED